jgi:hypothetical protein
MSNSCTTLIVRVLGHWDREAVVTRDSIKVSKVEDCQASMRI